MRRLKLLFFFVCKSLGLFRVAQRLTKDRLRILCYHGFALGDEAAFRPKLFMSPGRFEQRLETIRRYGYRPLPLDEAVERMYERTLPPHSVVITIDDGFHSVYSVAVPRLERYGYPATVYVTTYYVQNPNPIFRLVVQYMFWKTTKRQLVLQDVPWSENRTVDLTDPAAAEDALWQCIDYGERECTEETRCSISRTLGELLGTPYDEIVRTKILSLMTPHELASVAQHGIDVELHTHRHVFPAHDQALAVREITDNRTLLMRWLSFEPRHFCYPSGQWDPRQWPWLDEMGVKSSTTCIPGLNSAATPRHALHRFLDAENIHALEFEAALTGFTDLVRGLVGRSSALAPAPQNPPTAGAASSQVH